MSLCGKFIPDVCFYVKETSCPYLDENFKSANIPTRLGSGGLDPI